MEPRKLEDYQSPETLPLQKSRRIKIILLGIIFIIIGAGLFGASTYLGYTNGFMTDGQCSEIIYNATIYGYDIALSEVLNKTLKCEGVVSITFRNETYDIVAVKCLNLNNKGGNK